MFNLFKKNNNISAPVSGKCLDITQCSDAAFSSKMLGDGFMIIPDAEVIKAPCDGTITTIFPTKHAIGITNRQGAELLLHIGIDTVKLNGQHMDALVKVNDKIRVGTPLIKFDAEYMKEQQIDMSTIVVLLNGGDFKYHKNHLNEEVKAGDIIIHMESGD